MKRQQRMRALWIVLMGMIVLSGVAIPLWVMADSGSVTLTATLYADVIRFEAAGVASLRVTIYDLSENELWSSGQVLGDFVDWDRTNAYGERLANGYYLYLAEGWDATRQLVLSRPGKVVLLPGDRVELKRAPTSADSDSYRHTSPVIPKDVVSGDLVVNGRIFITGEGNRLYGAFGGAFRDQSGRTLFQPTGDHFSVISNDGNSWIADYTLTRTRWWTDGVEAMRIQGGQLGIGTDTPTARLTVEATSGDLIAAYSSGERVFAVDNIGNVFADGTVYSAGTETGGADVAERINVSEWVEAGDVVEIDPEHVGFFRKASGLYSRRVAGIISTSPGVILGNDIDSTADEWSDSRPVLAIAGRVPVKVSGENGPIAIGDLLVSSSTPGVAMKGDPTASIGAVVGKAMERLEDAEGIIMAQVTLR